MTNFQRLRARVLLRRIYREAHGAAMSWRWWLSLWPYALAALFVFMFGMTYGVHWTANYVQLHLTCKPL